MRRRLALCAALALLAVAICAPAGAQPTLEPRIYLPLLDKPCPPPLPVNKDDIQIIDVVLYDPNFPQDYEYTQVLNVTEKPIDMTGWWIVNTSRPRQKPYIFPPFTLEASFTAVVYGGIGNDDPLIGDFYWGNIRPIWRAGDVAELRATECQVISRLVVVQ